ncbi:MAG TPA: PrsW family intramembrane metalloprotease [Streptomyces sp.]|nr:PrsW family intramembrane metalloprotease [Streptomyces sp.]
MHQEVSAPPADGRAAPRCAPWWHGVRTRPDVHPRAAVRARSAAALRTAAVAVLLALCGVTVLALVREQTGPDGFLVGLGLAVLPVPPLVAAFRWLDRATPSPWRNLVFAFGWGACAATLVAIVTNGLATEWLTDSLLPRAPGRAESLGTTLVAPVVEETAKAGAVLLLDLLRPRDFGGTVCGTVVAGITATGFAFTENVLYLGRAFGEDLAFGHTGLESTTLGTFLQRIVMAPLAHPLFTVLTGLGFGAAALTARRRRAVRTALPLLGLAAGITLHAVWNGAASRPPETFFLVYGLFMAPVLGVVTWLVLWSRRRLLRTVRATLHGYAATGWLAAPEPYALGSPRARALARDLARRRYGRRAARTVAEYHRTAACLALLRARAERGAPPPDFPAHEHALLHTLWRHRPLAGPVTASAARVLPRPHAPPHSPPLPYTVPYLQPPPAHRG